MMSNKITILILIDALRYDYISDSNSPYLKVLTQTGISGRLMPTFGFEPDAAYITGLFPDESDGGAQFWFNPESSPFKSIQYIPKYLNSLPYIPSKIVRRIFDSVVRFFSKSPVCSSANVPFHLLKYLDFPMKASLEQPEFSSCRSVFDYLRKLKKKWMFHGIPNYRVDIDSVIRRVSYELHPPISFAFLHIGDLDRVGHKFGPSSSELKNTLKKVDNGIKKIINIAKSRFDSVDLVIIGDHGMIEVNKYIDIWSRLKQLSLQLEQDYLVFLDSTMARFWFFNKISKIKIIESLNGLAGGHILSKEEKIKYHLNYPHNRFGDIMFLADPGVLIFPNFYQWHKPLKGMHGYAPEVRGQQSAFIILSSKIKKTKQFDEPVDMRRIYPTILHLLNIDIPESIKIDRIF